MMSIFPSWQDKMKLQEEIIPYFCDVPKHIAPVLRTLAPHEVLSNVYRMTGYLVKYCAKLIYVRVSSLLNYITYKDFYRNNGVPRC